MKIDIIGSLQNYRAKYTTKRVNEPSLIVSAIERGLAVNDPVKGIVPLVPTVERILISGGINGLKTKTPVVSEIGFAKMTYELTVNITVQGATTVQNIVLPEKFSDAVAYWFVMISHVENDSDVTNLRARVVPGSLDTIEVSFKGAAGGENFNIYASGFVDKF